MSCVPKRVCPFPGPLAAMVTRPTAASSLWCQESCQLRDDRIFGTHTSPPLATRSRTLGAPLTGFGDVTVGDRDMAGDRDRLQHPTIVGDQEERARIGLEGAFQLLDRGQVEMVGGLVEDQ